MNSLAEAIGPTNGGQQGLISTAINFEQGQSSRAVTKISNPNNYVGLRISANGELINPFNMSSTTIFNNGATNNYANNNIGVNEVNLGMNYDNNHNSFGNDSNAPLVDDIFGVLNDMNAYMPVLDCNATQRENSPDLSNMQGIGDELRQLGIDIQFDQVQNYIYIHI